MLRGKGVIITTSPMDRFAYTQVEDTSDILNTYIGKTTVKDALYSDPVWQIQRISIQAPGVIKSEFADNDASDTHIWNNRAAYFGLPVGGTFSSTKSVLFDGTNDYMVIGQTTNPIFQGTVPFSISAWIKPNSIAANRPIFAQFTTAGFAIIILTTGVVRFRISAVNNTNELRIDSVPTIRLGVWTHLVITYDGSRTPDGVDMYINGSLVAQTTVVNNLKSAPNITSNWRIGATESVSSPTYYSGQIDELSVWDKALSSAEVLGLYNSGEPGNLEVLPAYSNCIGWWRMGEDAVFPNIPDKVAAYTGVMVNMGSLQILTDAP